MEERRKRVWLKAPIGFRYLVRIIDFTYKRVLPKLPFIKKIYFALTQGHNRVLSKAEVMGRLISCGFQIERYFEHENLFYIISKKINVPDFNLSPSYSPIFKMQRIGYKGKKISVYKLRTMYPYSEYLQDLITKENKLADSGKILNDYRVTTWGRFCRKFWIDEIPMLINVFKCQLNIIGVRPLSKSYFDSYPLYLQKLRIKLRKLEVFQKWLLADHRQIRKNLKEKRDLVKQLNNKLHNEAKQNNSLKKNMDDLKVKQEHEIEELRKNSPVKIVEKVIIQEKVVVPSVQLEEPVVVAATPEQQQQQPPKPKATFVVQTQTEQSSFVKEEDKEEIIMIEEEQQVEDISIQATPQETFSNYNSHDRTMNFSQLIDDNDDDGNDSDDYNNYSRSVIVKKWKKMNMPSGDAEGFLQSFINRANSLRNEAADNATPGILRNTQQLITDVAERIAIETYDTGEYLYDISVEMQPTLAEAYRLRMANSNSSKVAEIKGKAAAVSSVARTRIRAALHLSRDGMLSWLLTIFSNAMKLLIELQTPGQVLDDDIDDGDFNSKEKDRIAKQIVSQSSEELIRICSEQWTKRRWPHTDPNANLLEEVRADVQVAAEEEYWRRYVETVSGQRAAGNDLSRHDLLEVEVSCAPADLPQFIEVDVSEIRLEQILHLSEIEAPKGLTFVALSHDNNLPVVSVNKIKGTTSSEDAE